MALPRRALSVLPVLVALLASAPVLAQSDIEPPALNGFDFAPRAVDVTATSANVGCTFAASDAGAGVYFVDCTFTSPSGAQFASCGAWMPISGDSHNGVWSCDATLPRYAEDGAWTTLVRLKDNAFNERHYQPADLVAAGFPSQLAVSDASPDTAAPAVTAAAFSPTAIDINLGPGTIVCNVSANDLPSGAYWIGCEFWSPSATQYAACGSWVPVSGDAHAGIWTCTATIPRYSEAGVWLLHVRAKDNVFNEHTYAPEELEALGIAERLFVLSGSDTSPPAITLFDFNPKSIDITSAASPVACQVAASDAMAGVLWIGCDFWSPSAVQVASCASYAPSAGSMHDGTWSCDVTIPLHAESGVWLASARAKDNVGNERSYAPFELEALGASVRLTVCADHLGRDTDADAHGDDCDNCPNASNVDQADTDSDAVGDLCDDCPSNFDPPQSDFDADGVGDHCDLNDGLIYEWRHNRTTVTWQQESGSTSWNLYFGDLDVLRATGTYTQAADSNPLAERICDLPSTNSVDAVEPSPGKVRFSLVTGVRSHREGSLGTDSAGAERPNTHPCPR